ncbi:MAG TPA: peptidoglycan DD-metalloendopeptidase family protein [Bacteroidales bacterium]|nr:peptidoglycan DD-metalloendopeptidase family protein [Bacteroidales bacterium]
MIIKAIISLLLVSVFLDLGAQSRTELENRRKKNLEEIEYVDRLLKNTASERKENLNELSVIGKKLSLREKIINEYGEEISLLRYRISLNKQAGEIMEEDLTRLKEEYGRSIINAYKATRGNPAVAFILSSTDFNQGYKRLKYIQQVARYRRNEAELISQIYYELQTTRAKLETDVKSINDLKRKEERQKQILREDQVRRERMVTTLGKKETQLKQQLEEKKRITRQIEAEIARVIEEERKKSVSTPMTNEMKLVGDSFGENKGRLPWPVEKGIITSHFGLQQHPVLKRVTEDNIGIEITSSGNIMAKSIFKGQAVRVFAISGANMAVIVRHGKYLTVYQNLVNLRVKAGEIVATGQVLGEVFSDSAEGNKAVLKFMIYEEKTKLNPELWLVNK